MGKQQDRIGTLADALWILEAEAYSAYKLATAIREDSIVADLHEAVDKIARVRQLLDIRLVQQE